MLTREENELLTRVGPGTPMGELMRRYWIPACLSEELEVEGEPTRLRILGEDLVAFRDTAGRVGLIDEFCPHRGVSLAYGRNEACGLRCLYHGWKVDVSGRIVDMPTEPPEHSFRERIRHVAYPAREAAGVVWAYMGPPGTEPVLPQWEWMQTGAEHLDLLRLREDCNWMQGLEGSIDSAHSDFLHSSDIGGRPRDHAPRLEVEDTPYGFRYAAIRSPDDDPRSKQYVRITAFAPPFHVFIPPHPRGDQVEVMHHAWVPIDDEHNYFCVFSLNREGSFPDRLRDRYELDAQLHPRRNRQNKHLQDRGAMKTRSWTGIPGVNMQDIAMVESGRPIIDRTREHLGTSDVAIIHMRRFMLGAVRRFQETGEVPGLDPGLPYHLLRSVEQVVPSGARWQDLASFGEHIVS